MALVMTSVGDNEEATKGNDLACIVSNFFISPSVPLLIPYTL